MRFSIKRKIGSFVLTVFRVSPIVHDKIVIVSYYGKGYGDSGKAVAEALHQKDSSLDIVWAARSEYRDSVPSYIRCVKYNSIRYLWEMASARVWLDNARKAEAYKKRKGQYYIQLWHGYYALKKIEKDVENKLPPQYVMDAKHDSQIADLFVSGSGFFTKLMKTVFWYDGEILECGSPRLDHMMRPPANIAETVRRRLNIPKDIKLVLYAPTFRADFKTECYDLNYEAVLDQLEQQTGDSWMLLIRLHPNVAPRAKNITYSDRIISATDYPDLYELIPASDLIITDYSSLMFEGGLIEKPVFLYASDINQYVEDRGFYFDIRQLPFPLAETNKQMIKNIKEFDGEKYRALLKALFDEMQPFENGNAADTVAERILTIMGRNEQKVDQKSRK